MVDADKAAPSTDGEMKDEGSTTAPSSLAGAKRGAKKAKASSAAQRSIQKRSYADELSYIRQLEQCEYEIAPGFVPRMRVPGRFFVNADLLPLVQQELEQACGSVSSGGFIPAVKQIANVSSLPGIVRASLAMPDVHSGYGFAIGNVAAFDMGDPDAVVSPGGVGFDINCGVRLLRTNLTEADLSEPGLKETLVQTLYNHIPVGVGSRGVVPIDMRSVDDILRLGMDWAVREGYAWVGDKTRCEEYGRMLQADPSKVSLRAKKRGVTQLGTLGAGNHYTEIQIVDHVFDEHAAAVLGLTKGQVVVMIHSGSRGLGHQVATDALQAMERCGGMRPEDLNDRQLACAPIRSDAGRDYLAAMACAANFAWVNRSAMTFLARQAFAKVFQRSPRELGMDVVYDVSHNIAKVEAHVVDGVPMQCLVHRKGATRAFPPYHPLLPVEYQAVGQPVLIGGTMGTCSYVLLGTEKGMSKTFGSTCHGAGRAQSRAACRRKLNYQEVVNNLKKKGISIRVASPKLITEEAPESYKDVSAVVETCEVAGISKKCVRLRPVAVIKG